MPFFSSWCCSGSEARNTQYLLDAMDDVLEGTEYGEGARCSLLCCCSSSSKRGHFRRQKRQRPPTSSNDAFALSFASLAFCAGLACLVIQIVSLSTDPAFPAGYSLLHVDGHVAYSYSFAATLLAAAVACSVFLIQSRSMIVRTDSPSSLCTATLAHVVFLVLLAYTDFTTFATCQESSQGKQLVPSLRFVAMGLVTLPRPFAAMLTAQRGKVSLPLFSAGYFFLFLAQLIDTSAFTFKYIAAPPTCLIPANNSALLACLAGASLLLVFLTWVMLKNMARNVCVELGLQHDGSRYTRAGHPCTSHDGGSSLQPQRHMTSEYTNPLHTSPSRVRSLSRAANPQSPRRHAARSYGTLERNLESSISSDLPAPMARSDSAALSSGRKPLHSSPHDAMNNPASPHQQQSSKPAFKGKRIEEVVEDSAVDARQDTADVIAIMEQHKQRIHDYDGPPSSHLNTTETHAQCSREGRTDSCRHHRAHSPSVSSQGERPCSESGDGVGSSSEGGDTDKEQRPRDVASIANSNTTFHVHSERSDRTEIQQRSHLAMNAMVPDLGTFEEEARVLSTSLMHRNSEATTGERELSSETTSFDVSTTGTAPTSKKRVKKRLPKPNKPGRKARHRTHQGDGNTDASMIAFSATADERSSTSHRADHREAHSCSPLSHAAPPSTHSARSTTSTLKGVDGQSSCEILPSKRVHESAALSSTQAQVRLATLRSLDKDPTSDSRDSLAWDGNYIPVSEQTSLLTGTQQEYLFSSDDATSK